MIVNLNLRKCENGWFVNFTEDGRAKDRVFYTWQELCDWMSSKAEEQAAKGAQPGPGKG